jgi:ribA/ribD-fused uncharacterized protein
MSPEQRLAALRAAESAGEPLDLLRYDIVVAGNLAKFGQHDDLRAFLVGTGRKVLVEASPYDRIWGIGMAAGNPDAHRPSAWRGCNLLGFALMEVRERL